MVDDAQAKLDYQAKAGTWNGFCKLMLWSTVSVAILLILMAAFLV
jgi:hypothetical protein